MYYNENKYLNDLLNGMLSEPDTFKYECAYIFEDYNAYIFYWDYGVITGSAAILITDKNKISHNSYIEIEHISFMLFEYEHKLLHIIFENMLDSIGVEYK